MKQQQNPSGPQTEAWRAWSARQRERILQQPMDQRLKIIQMAEFKNLTKEDQTAIWSTLKPMTFQPKLPRVLKTSTPHKEGSEGPRRGSIGNELRADISARCLAIALSWSDETLLRFTKHRKFENLIPEDKSRVLERLQAKITQPTAAPPPHQPPSTPKLLRVPAALAPAIENSAGPRHSLISGELRVALVEASIYWVTAIAVGTIGLKFFAGGY
jgi:hypothetical protein